MVRRYIIGEEEVRHMPLNILVDTGSYMLCINESIQAKIQFQIVEKWKPQTANGHNVECDVLSTVELKFKNRRTMCNAMVLPGDAKPLLGAIPLEDMGVLIHTLR